MLTKHWKKEMQLPCVKFRGNFMGGGRTKKSWGIHRKSLNIIILWRTELQCKLKQKIVEDYLMKPCFWSVPAIHCNLGFPLGAMENFEGHQGTTKQGPICQFPQIYKCDFISQPKFVIYNEILLSLLAYKGIDGSVVVEI